MLKIIDTHLLCSERDRRLVKSATPHSRRHLRFRSLRPQSFSYRDSKSRALELIYALSAEHKLPARCLIPNSERKHLRRLHVLSALRLSVECSSTKGALENEVHDSNGRYSAMVPVSPTFSTTSIRSHAGSSVARGSTPRPHPGAFALQPPRIRVDSLLHSSGARSYRLEVVQQPQRGAEFGNTSLSRLPISPPIIVKLHISDDSGNSMKADQELPFLIAHLSLLDERGSRIPDSSRTRLLYGNLVSSINQLEDSQGNPGLFFLFPDVSVRRCGQFQLCITLMRISGPGGASLLEESQSGGVLAEEQTLPFAVVPTSQFTSVAPTRMSQAFARQGARLSGFSR